MTRRRRIALRLACVCTLLALALMAWGIVHPVPLAVIAAMSVGQGVGTLGFLLFCFVVAPDVLPIFRKRSASIPPEARPRSSEPPESKPPES